ncbi:hypothetical protein GQ44DRAFT_727442 [Phaeosphaeriaceae sp. PMI808]|nr:hypothetical protein GQ44DRAFT_727442 [Phaeosphaeriaceae sp. PMI808]
MARKKVWQHCLGKVEQFSAKFEERGEAQVALSELEYDELSKRALNGRQIKNIVQLSKFIALAEKIALSMGHVKRVLELAQVFEDDMRGGKGYREAMRHYT